MRGTWGLDTLLNMIQHTQHLQEFRLLHSKVEVGFTT